MAAERRPSFGQSLIAGGAAGTASAQGFVKAGGFAGIYKGVGSVVVGSAPGAAVFFSTYDFMKRTLPMQGQLAPLNHMISASVGEGACLIRVPTEQTSSYGSSVASSLAAAKLVLRNDGVKGFYRGFGITVIREIPFTSLQFPLYEYLKYRLSLALDSRPLHAAEAAVCGSIAGGVAAALTTPLDVLKTRVMLDMRDPSSRFPSLLTRARQIYVNEGVNALFAGVVPRTLWISAGGAVFLGVYEWVIETLVDS
ncbi:mitochondrial carrier domain-containing protein [Pisolithus marmoratus]|nr:mitochondrial carrier domain-containing protein [Pisolithus marmoratus]